MKKLCLAIGLIFVFLASSCITNKELVYLQDKGTIIDSLAITSLSQPYRVQTNDILSITVKALDPELTSIFNPVTENTNGQSNTQNLYFTGFTVDDHGNIKFPILGWWAPS